MAKAIFIIILLNSLLLSTTIDHIKRSIALNYVEQMQNIMVIQKENKDLIKQNSIYYTNITKEAKNYVKKIKIYSQNYQKWDIEL